MDEVLTLFSPSHNVRVQPCGHTSQQWDAQRAEITKLYGLQNLSLRDVIETMKVQFSFLATERQYKTRITQWGLDKKVKHHEMKAIVRIERKRKMQEGKDTCFRVRKRSVDPKKIKRFIKDHPNVEGSSSKSSTPSVISYCTIRPSDHLVSSPSRQSPFDLGLASHEPNSTSTSGTSAKNLSVQIQLPANTNHDSRVLPETYKERDQGINTHRELDSALSGVSDRKRPVSRSTADDSTLMREFFDFSAAAKTEVKSASSITQFTHLDQRSAGTGIHNGSEIQESIRGGKSEDEVLETLDSLIELAGRVEDQGKYEWSRVLLQRAVRLHRQYFDNKHPSTLDALEALSRILRSQGRYLQAERLLSGALRAFRKTRGDKHADTLDCVTLLALVMMDQGRHAEAETHARIALEARLGFLDTNDTGVLRSKETLGIVLTSAGDDIAAEQLHREVLAARSKSLGADHSKTLNAMHNLAVSLGGQEKYKMMESIYRSMVEIQTKSIGALHPQTLNSRHGIATALGGQKRYEEARLEYRDIIALKRSTSGDEHPHTLNSMHNLAGILSHQGKYDEARRLYSQVLQIERRTLGPEHPSTLENQDRLISTLENLGEDDEAEALSRMTLESRQNGLGVEHPSTLASKGRLARLLGDKGDYGECLRLYHEVLDVRQKVLGSQHLLTTMTLGRMRMVELFVGEETESTDSEPDSV